MKEVPFVIVQGGLDKCPLCWCIHFGECDPATEDAGLCTMCGCQNTLVTDFGPEEFWDCRPMCQTDD